MATARDVEMGLEEVRVYLSQKAKTLGYRWRVEAAQRLLESLAQRVKELESIPAQPTPVKEGPE